MNKEEFAEKLYEAGLNPAGFFTFNPWPKYREDIASELLKSLDITPKAEKPEERRKGERRGADEWPTRYPQRRRSDNDRRKEKPDSQPEQNMYYYSMLEQRNDTMTARIEQLEKQLKDTTANHTINHTAHLVTVSNVARLEKELVDALAVVTILKDRIKRIRALSVGG